MTHASAQSQPQGFRAAFLDFTGDPFLAPETDCVRFIADGLLVVGDGCILEFGDHATVSQNWADLPVQHFPAQLLLPGMIDTHIHFPQLGMMAAYGEQLLQWLERYTFPTEQRFQDPDYAREMAELFLEQLLQNGTTTALVFAAVFPESVEAFFEAAQARRLRMIAGKVMMDRHAPDYLRDTSESSYQQSKALIEKWHGRDRLLYAVTPRFAATSTPEQLRLAGQLLAEFPDVYLQTHIAENRSEVAWIRQLFPDSQHYLDVYDQAGLVGERSVFAHGIHLSEAEWQRLRTAKSAIAFCPTSNLFLGSGLFNLQRAKSPEAPVKVGLGTDVGAGTSFSLLQTTSEAYKVAQLQGQSLSAFQALFLATLGGAQVLCLEDRLGSFEPGKEADFIALDYRATTPLALRNPTDPQTLEAVAECAFSLAVLGDDRAIAATYVLGELAYKKSS